MENDSHQNKNPISVNSKSAVCTVASVLISKVGNRGFLDFCMLLSYANPIFAKGAWQCMRRRIISVLTVTAFAAYLLVFGCPHYDLIDDVILMDSLMGAVGGVQESFNFQVLFPLFGMLHLLSRGFPAVAWFSVFQLTLLVVSAYVIMQSSMRLAYKIHLPQWLGWIIGALYVWIFVVPFANFISFTYTATITAMASVWQLACVDWKRKSCIRLSGQSVLLMLAAFCLRWESVLPALCYWTGILLCAVLLERVPVKRTAILWGICILVLGTAMGIHQAASLTENEYVRFQKARIQVMDYGLLDENDTEVLKSAGWTRNDAQLVQNWCLFDEKISAETFATISANSKRKMNESDAGLRIVQLFTKNRNLYWIAALLILQLGLAFGVGLWERQLWAATAAIVIGVGTAVMLLVLSLRGRLPMRAGAAVLWPACTAAAYLLLRGVAYLWHASGKHRFICLLASLMCLVIAYPNIRQAFHNSYQPYSLAAESEYTHLIQYANEKSDQLLFVDGSLGCNPRLFPVRSGKPPQNLLLAWGGWNNHSQGYRALFERFGYQHDAFLLEYFLDDKIAFVLPADREPPEWLISALCERTGTDVTWVAEEYASLRILHFKKGTAV